jgi:hypothetical protein
MAGAVGVSPTHLSGGRVGRTTSLYGDETSLRRKAHSRHLKRLQRADHNLADLNVVRYA